MYSITYAGLTDLGQVREDNEDNWVADPKLGLYAVADGMGGQLGGGLASRIVVETLPLLVRKRLADESGSNPIEIAKRAAGLLGELSTLLRDGSRDEPGLRGMGSTVVMVIVRVPWVVVAHLGDSRAYVFRNGQLRQHTTDHTLIQLLLQSGDITPEEAAVHPARGQLTRFVGMEGEPLPETCELELKADDVILLCSDGLTGMVDNDAIAEILAEHGEPKAACESLVLAANQAGGKDNICVLVMKCWDEK